MPKRDVPSVAALLLLLLAGLSALGGALASALVAVGVDGRPDDVITEFGGHREGGTTDTLTAVILALVLGTVGVCAFSGAGANSPSGSAIRRVDVQTVPPPSAT